MRGAARSSLISTRAHRPRAGRAIQRACPVLPETTSSRFLQRCAAAAPPVARLAPQPKAQPAAARRTRAHSSRNMSHKVIDLASDEEKEKAGPIDLANSSDEDVEDREDLQVACPKCTLLNAGDADQCVACGNQLRAAAQPSKVASRWDREDRAGASTWGRADGTPWSQKPKTGGFRIPTRSDVDAKKKRPPPPTDCKPVAASKRAKQLQAAGSRRQALRDIEKIEFDPLAVRRGAFADDAPPPQQKPRFESLASLPSPGSAAAAKDAIRSTASHAAAGLRSDAERQRAAVDSWDTKEEAAGRAAAHAPQTRSVAEMLNCPGAATVKPIRVPVPALGEDAWVLRGALGAEVRSWSKIYVH